MCNYNSMVNAFFKLDGHMFCLNSFSFVLPFAKKLIIRNKSRDFQMQCNLDEKGFEICLLRVFLFFSKVKSNSTLLPYGYNSLKLQEIEVMILCLMIVCLKSNIPRLSQFSFY